MMESVVSGHTYTAIRERLGDKLETIRFDPFSKLFITNIFELNGNSTSLFQYKRKVFIRRKRRSVVCNKKRVICM